MTTIEYEQNAASVVLDLQRELEEKGNDHHELVLEFQQFQDDARAEKEELEYQIQKKEEKITEKDETITELEHSKFGLEFFNKSLSDIYKENHVKFTMKIFDMQKEFEEQRDKLDRMKQQLDDMATAAKILEEDRRRARALDRQLRV